MVQRKVLRRKVTQPEVRHVLTFWGIRGWDHLPSEGISYNSSSILRGQQGLNEVINKLAKLVTIQSVSYSHVIFPPSNITAICLFATVVYTGPSVLELYGTRNPYGSGDISAETTLLEVSPL